MEELAAAFAEEKIATLRWELPYMAAGKKRVDNLEISTAAVRATWLESAREVRGLARFAGGKSFGGRMTSNAHALGALPDLRGIVFFGFPLHPAGKPGIERAAHLSEAAGPMLFLTGARDELADLSLLRPVVKKLGERATLRVVEGADHGFTRPRGAIAELAAATAEWMKRVVDS